MKKYLSAFLLLTCLFIVNPRAGALTRTFQIEPWGFLAGKVNLQNARKINLQVEWKTAPYKSMFADGAVNWNNELGKPIFWSAGAGLRRYTFDDFSGPWYGARVQLSQSGEQKLIQPALLGGFKWVLTAGFTQEAYVGVRLDQPLGGEDSLTQINSFMTYTLGYSF